MNEELVRMAREQDEFAPDKVRDLKYAIDGLLATDGWKHLEKIIQVQLDVRLERILLVEPKGLDSIPGDLYARGEMAALKLVLNMPKFILEQANEVISRLEGQEDVTE